MNDEIAEGRLCEKGLMKETYDEEVQDLVRKITPAGKAYVKNLLKKNPESRARFLLIMKETMEGIPPELHKDFLIEVMKDLK